ncbi:MAG: winged helix-turn-helix transcriptional regulator [Methanoregula sp.]|nr:winged helix-turn-helix transcriptional regulator [Methanoregula sp.]
MVKCPVLTVAFLISFFILIAPVVVADTGGYVVKPVSHDMISGTPHDPVSVTFWELSPRVMAIAIALSFFPVLVFPIEILFTLKILLWLGYRKVAQNAIFQNSNRLTVFEAIKANPGINFHALSKLVCLKRGSMRYHLEVLSRTGKIVEVNSLNIIGYFENTGRFTEFEKKMLKHLQNITEQKIMGVLITSPNISRRDIVGMIGIAGPSITWHTNRLSQGGIITIKKTGRDVRYTLTREASDFFLKYHRNFSENISKKISEHLI